MQLLSLSNSSCGLFQETVCQNPSCFFVQFTSGFVESICLLKRERTPCFLLKMGDNFDFEVCVLFAKSTACNVDFAVLFFRGSNEISHATISY